MANATIYALLGAAPGLVIVALTWVKGLRLESRAPTQGTPALLAGDPSTFLFGVKAPFAKMPPQAREVTFWADVKFSLAEPYKPLIDGARLRFEDAPPGG